MAEIEKPHKGLITHWKKHKFNSSEAKNQYGEKPGKGFLILGRFQDHPQFRGQSGNTSWVTKWEKKEDGTVEIETRNSRYTLEKQ